MPDLIRASMPLLHNERQCQWNDCRVKPGNDECQGCWRLKQAELLAWKDGRGEQVGAKLDRLFIEAKALGGDLESPPDHPGIGPLAHHALTPFRLIELAAARRAHQRQNSVG